MKKVISMLLSAAILLTATVGLDLTAYATEYSGTCGGNVTWSLDTDTGVLTISGSGEMTDYSTGSSTPWYDYVSYINTVTIEDGITSIGNYAFYNCTGLTSVTISDSVTSIKTSAFADCTALTSITIPDSVRDIAYEAFYSCTSLTNVTIPNGLTSINDSLFCNCTSLESITIPDSVTSIGNYAFCDCTSLARITIPDSVTSIKTSAFRGCTALTSVTILNYNCDIDYSSDTFYSKATIYGYADSTAQEYAEAYDRTFVSFESCTHTYSDGVCSICGYTPQSISLGDTNTVTISTAGYYQYYYFKPAQSGSYTFYSTGSVDTYGYVYDGNLTQLTYNDDGGSGTNFSITYSFEADTVYILACRLYSSSNTGSFDVTLTTCATHSYDITERYEATCTAAGYSVYTCSACGDTYTSNIVSATGHTWDSGVITTASTCITSGVKTYTCITCGETKKEITSATNHKYTAVTISPTCTSNGYTTYTCIYCGKTYTSNIIPANGHSDLGDRIENIVPATQSEDGSYDLVSYCIECNADVETETIKIPKISSITLSKNAYTYDGKVKNPSVIIKDTNGNKISPEYYTVTYASDCRKVGKYKVTVEFTGNYSGTKALYFKIKPKTTRFTSVTVNSRIVSVKWQKQTKQVTGYQIQLSTTKKFKKSSSITFTNKDPKQSSFSTSNTGLRTKKALYIRIRTYKTVNGKKIYSKWSKVKKVKKVR